MLSGVLQADANAEIGPSPGLSLFTITISVGAGKIQKSTGLLIEQVRLACRLGAKKLGVALKARALRLQRRQIPLHRGNFSAKHPVGNQSMWTSHSIRRDIDCHRDERSKEQI